MAGLHKAAPPKATQPAYTFQRARIRSLLRPSLFFGVGQIINRTN